MYAWEKTQYIPGSVLSSVSGTHWEFWNVIPKDKAGLLLGKGRDFQGVLTEVNRITYNSTP